MTGRAGGFEQGQVWRVGGLSGITWTMLIVEASYITQATPDNDIFCVVLDDSGLLPETVLSPRVGDRVADIRSLASFRRERFETLVGKATTTELHAVKAAISALIDS